MRVCDSEEQVCVVEPGVCLPIVSSAKSSDSHDIQKKKKQTVYHED